VEKYISSALSVTQGDKKPGAQMLAGLRVYRIERSFININHFDFDAG
jgi:hypothetical protein